MRSVGVVTTSRSDFGVYLPLLRRFRERSDVRLMLYVTGMHLAREFGYTVDWITAEGIPIHERIPILVSGDDAEAAGKSIGLGLLGFSQSFSRVKPDILVVLGDRFEMIAAALAALPFRIPVAHIHGGELTFGAIDDAIRHSITKLSHLHFTSTHEYARRVVQMGEEPWRVIVSGAPALDHLRQLRLPSKEEIEEELKLLFVPSPLLVTFHPTTLDPTPVEDQMTEVLEALKTIDRPMIFTAPNADPGGQQIANRIIEYVQNQPKCRYVKNLGTRSYFGLMQYAAAMIGNSSSGIVEAPSFKLPVVNIGSRQDGRIRAKNVIDVPNNRVSIVEGISKALSDSFRSGLQNLVNPYQSDRPASDIITEHLSSVEITSRFLQKRFVTIGYSHRQTAPSDWEQEAGQPGVLSSR